MTNWTALSKWEHTETYQFINKTVRSEVNSYECQLLRHEKKLPIDQEIISHESQYFGAVPKHIDIRNTKFVRNKTHHQWIFCQILSISWHDLLFLQSAYISSLWVSSRNVVMVELNNKHLQDAYSYKAAASQISTNVALLTRGCAWEIFVVLKGSIWLKMIRWTCSAAFPSDFGAGPFIWWLTRN